MESNNTSATAELNMSRVIKSIYLNLTPVSFPLQRAPLPFSRFWQRPLTAQFLLKQFHDCSSSSLLYTYARLCFRISNCSPLELPQTIISKADNRPSRRLLRRLVEVRVTLIDPPDRVGQQYFFVSCISRTSCNEMIILVS